MLCPQANQRDMKALCSFRKDKLVPAGGRGTGFLPASTSCPDGMSPSWGPQILGRLPRAQNKGDHQHSALLGNLFPSPWVSKRLEHRPTGSKARHLLLRCTHAASATQSNKKELSSAGYTCKLRVWVSTQGRDRPALNERDTGNLME